MNAASTRGIDDVRSLLEQATYAPTQGRFKVYMLDEVHQLTKDAFNALLKTLEEPPAHVKFILGTTDPQKVPVTILSRCLQFNLRQMASTTVNSHLQAVLTQENIAFEASAVQLISRAAAGSMRDALSLLDQAIAYGNNTVNENEVRSMLGAIDQSYLFELLQALINQDGKSLLAQAKTMEQRSLSFDAALNDLANLLQQVAVAKTVPDSVADDLPERVALFDLAQKLSAEEIQLYYQIALLGRRDLGLAPDEYAGFTMVLLRMLAFKPSDSNKPTELSAPNKPDNQSTAKPAVALASAALVSASMQRSIEPPPVNVPFAAQSNVTYSSHVTQSEDAPQTQESSPQSHVAFDGDWRKLVDQLKLGLARALAQNCELARFDENSISLTVPETQKHLLDASYQEKLRTAIHSHFGRKIQLSFDIGGTGNTPAVQISQEKATIQSNAVTAIQQDDFVQALVKDFGAQIIPSSIKPLLQ